MMANSPVTANLTSFLESPSKPSPTPCFTSNAVRFTSAVGSSHSGVDVGSDVCSAFSFGEDRDVAPMLAASLPVLWMAGVGCCAVSYTHLTLQTTPYV